MTYKGHRIRFTNHPVFGERLYIDDTLADRGRFGFEATLRGTIEQGRGAGERITAQIRATFTRLACRIVAESFTPSARSSYEPGSDLDSCTDRKNQDLTRLCTGGTARG